MRRNSLLFYPSVSKQAIMTKGAICISKPILLKQVRDDGEHKKLLFNVLVKEDSLIIATKARGSKEETQVAVESILEPYVKPEEIKVLKETCNSIYKKKTNNL